MAATQLTSPERYELIERLAVGGMAEVFRAVAYGAHGFEKALAIKRILPELARDPEFESRFIGEAKLAVKLSHANVVQVLDFGRMGGTLFIAMELVDGLDLAALLRPLQGARSSAADSRRAPHLDRDRARARLRASARRGPPRRLALEHPHQPRGGGEDRRLRDRARRPAAAPRPTSAAIMGKWRYMSPEQGAGEAVDIRSDIFSAAAVWFELFTGDKLFPARTPTRIIRNIGRMKIPKASARRAGLPSRLDELLCAALEREPARRPDGGELVRGLVEVSYGSSIVASALDVKAAVAEALADRRPRPALAQRPPRAGSTISSASSSARPTICSRMKKAGAPRSRRHRPTPSR
jgi:serine/threonine protein kinase